MAVIPKFWYEPGRIPSILEGFIPGWKESFQDGRNPSEVGLHILVILKDKWVKYMFRNVKPPVNMNKKAKNVHKTTCFSSCNGQ